MGIKMIFRLGRITESPCISYCYLIGAVAMNCWHDFSHVSPCPIEYMFPTKYLPSRARRLDVQFRHFPPASSPGLCVALSGCFWQPLIARYIWGYAGYQWGYGHVMMCHVTTANPFLMHDSCHFISICLWLDVFILWMAEILHHQKDGRN